MKNILKTIIITYILSHFVSVNAQKDLSLDKGVFTLNCAPYQIRISRECKYTIASVKYKDYYIVPQSGYNGTVILFLPKPRNLKICGIGHVNGGEEKVISFELKADGKIINPQEGESITASSFELSKISKLVNIKLYSKIIINKNGIFDKRSIEAEEDLKHLYLYLYMYCFSGKTKEWIACLNDGNITTGTFTSKNKFVLNKDVKWFGQFDPAASIGVLGYYPVEVKGKNKRSTFWDKKNYHKYYFILNTPRVLPKGYKLEEKTLVIKCFEANKKNWKDVLKKIVKSLDS